MTKLQLFVGCGGTGIKTLRRLNALLAQDDEWRPRLGRDVYYLVVDTSQKELDDFEREIKADLGAARAPHIQKIALAQRIETLQSVLQAHFVDPFRGKSGEELEGLGRLRQHFWFDSSGQPFWARKARPLSEGAGQCPPASYLLAWKEMGDSLSDACERLAEELKKRREHQGFEASDRLGMQIISGLAGGTGRGCWEIVGLFLRTRLGQALGGKLSPNAYLVDGQCYRAIYKKMKRCEVPMLTNSITGLSQLSAWLHRPQADEFLDYSLPHMQAPEDPSQDVIRLDESRDNYGDRPAHKVFLICEGNRRVELADGDQYLEMLGTCLYSDLHSLGAERGQGATAVNFGDELFSHGATTLEVQAVRIRRFLESHVRGMFVERLGKESTAPEGYGRRVLELLHLDEAMAVGAGAGSGQAGAQEREGGGLGIESAVLAQLQGSKLASERWGELYARLKKATDVEKAVSASVHCVSLPEGEAEKIAQEALDKAGIQFEGRLLEEAQRVLRETGSLRGVASHLNAAAVALEGLGRSGGVQYADSREKLVDDFAKFIRGEGGRRYMLFGARYDQGELDRLGKKFESAYFLPIALASVRDAWQDRARELAAEARRWATEAEHLAGLLGDLRQGLDDASREAVGLAKGTDPLRALFLDPGRPEDHLPVLDSQERFYQRILAPLYPEKKLEEILQGTGMAESLRGLLIEAIRQPFDREDRHAAQDFKERVRAEVDAQVRVSPSDIESICNLRSVAQDHHDAWEERFAGLLGNQDEFHALSMRFGQFYGFEPRLPEKSTDPFFLMPGVQKDSIGDEFLIRIAVDMAAHCSPYWALDGDTQDDLQRVLYLPRGGADAANSANDYEERLLASYRALVRDKWADRAEPDVVLTSNPYMAIAYSEQATRSFDDIESIRYWSEHPDLVANLRAAEVPEEELPFREDGCNGGLGFTSPVYVQDERFVARRWRPWFSGMESRVGRERQRALTALAYALSEQEIKDKRYGTWELPLLEKDQEGWFRFRRSERFYDETDESGRAEDRIKECLDSPAWTAGERFALGIARVLDALTGVSTDGGPSAEKGLHVRGRILEERKEFWNDFAHLRRYGEGGAPHRKALEHLAKRCATEASEARKGLKEDDAKAWDELREFVQARRAELSAGKARG